MEPALLLHPFLRMFTNAVLRIRAPRSVGGFCAKGNTFAVSVGVARIRSLEESGIQLERSKIGQLLNKLPRPEPRFPRLAHCEAKSSADIQPGPRSNTFGRVLASMKTSRSRKSCSNSAEGRRLGRARGATCQISKILVCVQAGMNVAGKTGTSDDENDVWFVGFTNDVTAAVWVGYDNADGKRRTLGCVYRKLRFCNIYDAARRGQVVI
jgi:hypothetical protein